MASGAQRSEGQDVRCGHVAGARRGRNDEQPRADSGRRAVLPSRGSRRRATSERWRLAARGVSRQPIAYGHGAALAEHLGRELGDQPRLADPRGARDEDQAAGAIRGPPPVSPQPVELAVAPVQRRARVELGGSSRARAPAARAQASWRRIASCRRRSSGPARRRSARRATLAPPGRRPAPRLAPGAVQRQHALRVQPLAQRLARRAAPRARRAPRAWRPAARSESIASSAACSPQVLQAPDLRGGERLVRDIGERVAAPQRQRFARARRLEQPLETDGVHLARRRAGTRSRARA